MQYIPERGSTHIYHVSKIDQNKMFEMLARCTYENPPFCNAACPLKVDTKGMIAALASGDFKKALQIYEKSTPFPKLLSKKCEAPCEGKCRLCEIGDGVCISDLEKAIAEYGARTVGSGVFRMKKKKKVALFGDDLFCLFLAGEVEKKMYPLTLYTSASSKEDYLKMNDAAEEFERFNGMDIDFEFNCSIDKTLVDVVKDGYDVLCFGEDAAKAVYDVPVCSERTMTYDDAHVVMGIKGSCLESAFAAKKAALTVDRFAQNLAADNMRGEEGTVESRLYTNFEEAKELKRFEINSPEDAVSEAKRCIQCHCEECVKTCAFLQRYKKKPGLIGREIYNNTQIIMGDHQLNVPMNTCSLCSQCTFTCPNGMDMAEICHESRKNMVATDKMSNAPHEFALLDMLFSNDDAFLSKPQDGFDKCRYVFFPGCQANSIAPNTVLAAYEDLCARLDGGVAIMLGCCGAIADWAGRYEMYDKQKEFIDSELEKLGNPVIITACPTCRKELSRHQCIGIWDILNEIGLPEAETRVPEKAAMHDSCGARGDAQTQNSIRAIAEKLGIEIIDTPYSKDKSPCCGYGGLAVYANREVADEMTTICLERSEEPYISYCMACRDRFARQGRESRHILELVYGKGASETPDISEKRYNRLMLKKILGGEDMEDRPGFDVEYTDEALRIMDSRLILKSDVESVLKWARESGEAIYDDENKVCIATYRLGNVTFWVKYNETDTGYIVEGAYSHRMTVEKREG